jgi:hypothetical protein
LKKILAFRREWLLQATKKRVMPKINSILGQISGKLDNRVFVKGKKANFIRNTPAKGSKKDEPELKKRYKATPLLNEFAGEMNRIIKIYCHGFKPSRFYTKVLGRFLKDASKLRVLQLLKLKGLEINPRYPLSRLGSCKTDVTQKGNKIVVSIDTLSHPLPGTHDADCYYYEVLLLSWTKGKSKATHLCQISDWIQINGGLPEFEFLFPKSATTIHWLLCLGQRLGGQEKEIRAFAGQGMQIADAGTFDKKEQAMLKKMNEEGSARINKAANKEAPKEIVRVKAKRMKANSFGQGK